MTEMYDEIACENKESMPNTFYLKNGITRQKFVNLVDDQEVQYHLYNCVSLDSVNIEKYLTLLLSRRLANMIPKNITKLLIVGLGNRHISADSLGAEAIKNVFVDYNDILHSSMQLMAISTGVLSMTGMEAMDIIDSLVSKCNADAVVVIDSLCAKSYTRLGKSFQINNCGIRPGAGIGNKRKNISKSTIGVPVIVVGVPLVMYANDMCDDIPMNVVVTMKDIDIVVKRCGRIIGFAINHLCHKLNYDECIKIKM